MKRSLFLTLILPWSIANSQPYNCPSVYPGKDAVKPLPLTNAIMRFGENRGDGWLHGVEEATKQGLDTHYVLPESEKKWLVCSYGGKKRISGTLINGTEWGQYVADGQREWWIKLPINVVMCDLNVREVKSRNPGESTWTATAICE
jgi:hypothetical protein